MFTVRLSRKARKELESLPGRERDRVIGALKNLAGDPFAGKKLSGKFQGRYTIRVWPYRIMYTIEKRILEVLVVGIGHRQGIYNQIQETNYLLLTAKNRNHLTKSMQELKKGKTVRIRF